jgi:hypothetical protein
MSRGITQSDYVRMREMRVDVMWANLKDKDSAGLLADLRRNQAQGRYLLAGDIAAIRALLEPGKKVRDIGRAGLRKVLDDRFEYVQHELREGRM